MSQSPLVCTQLNGTKYEEIEKQIGLFNIDVATERKL